MTEQSRFVMLNRHVAGGLIDEDTFGINTRPMPQPSEGEVVLKPLALSVDPYMRGCMTGIDTFFLPCPGGRTSISTMSAARSARR